MISKKQKVLIRAGVDGTDEIYTTTKVTALTVRMSRENLYKLKEKVVRERTTMRKYVHFALGLKMEDEEKK